jgi:glutaminase
MNDYEQILRQIVDEMRDVPPAGVVAAYIPELAGVNPDLFGLALRTVEGQAFALGDSELRFSIQSISKVFALVLALAGDPEAVWKRIGVEPSGDPFNSLGLLEIEAGRPRNPLVNAGAIVLCDILLSVYDDPVGELLSLVRSMAGAEDIAVDAAVAASEFATGSRNRALAHLMSSFGNIRHDVEEVFQVYVRLCAIAMSCSELARAFGFLADGGRSLPDGFALNGRAIRRMNAIMLTCGFYDEAGEFAFSVGLPGKSGVGGGIAAVSPGRYSVVTWSPRLTKGGNSYLGTLALSRLTTLSETSIF